MQVLKFIELNIKIKLGIDTGGYFTWQLDIWRNLNN